MSPDHPDHAPLSGSHLVTEFQAREAERRRRRAERLDQASVLHAASTTRHRYYAAELQRLVRSLVPPGSKVLEIGAGSGDLLAAIGGPGSVGIDISPSAVEIARRRHPTLDLRVLDVEHDPLPDGLFDTIVLSDAIGMLDDIQAALERIRPLLHPEGRIVVTYYNFLWEPLLKLAEQIGLKTHWPDQNWLSMDDVHNLLYLTGFEVFRRGTDILMPAQVPGVSTMLNRVVAQLPVARAVSLVDYFVARPQPETVRTSANPSVSVICPCRNEKGNIREAVARTPLMGSATELVFVDGNSSDGTVEEIETMIRDYRGPLTLRLVHQGDGKGKGDAVRKGFAAAKHDVLMILDSDLTVPPEDLPKFYQALVSGKGEFINGVRLVYPMEGEAMRFLNLLGNKFFSTALSWLLEQPIKDSLCGTKVLYRSAYEMIAKHRSFFGDFDPFGDFDLLFGAARLNMRIVDLPVRYRARTYGETKINRFAHGWLLFKMTAFGFKKLRMGL
ncbi:MAG TPA: bifunctional class I SAM-dependent methyltransferase/glycosyltransferase family 2 protein [Polyangiaceae bacterium]|nr:bifunctional class I SAM-dependent methyltransferase/glycosyltransferase family 2 protein [Polyangiaceae bacterium]